VVVDDRPLAVGVGASGDQLAERDDLVAAAEEAELPSSICFAVGDILHYRAIHTTFKARVPNTWSDCTELEMQEELDALVRLLPPCDSIQIRHLEVLKTEFGGKRILLARSGVGKVNTAMHATLLLGSERIDAVVNVAGITRQTYFGKGTEEDWLAVLGVHLGGYLNVLGAALPLMAEAGHGRILGVTSGSGWREADAGAYSCAKRAVAALTWQLGRQAPPGVTVNAIAPGVFRTDLNSAFLDGTPRGQELLLRTPMGRFGKTEELVGCAIFLASDASSFVTGQTIVVDGGFLASGVNQ